MTTDSRLRPYSYLPEPFALVGVLVWIALLAAIWPNVTERGFAVRGVVYGALACGSVVHSWVIARRLAWATSLVAIVMSVVWLAAIAAATAILEWESTAPLVGVLAFLQLVECSFVTNRVTLRVTHAVAFGVMLLATPRLPVAGGGAAWVCFAVVSMFLLAYDRTARKAGPTGYNRGESRRLVQRIGAVSLIAVLAGLLFLVTPSLSLPEFRSPLPKTPARTTPKLPPGDPFGVGGTTATPDPRTGPLQLMTVATEPAVGGPLYLRGRVFDTFDGESWTDSYRETTTVPIEAGTWTQLPFAAAVTPASTTLLKQSVTMLVNMEGVIFTACRPTGIRFPDGNVDRVVVTEIDRSLTVSGLLADESHYEVNGFQDVFADPGFRGASSRRATEVTVRDLEIPSGISDRVQNLAISETASYQTPYQRALALERYLKRNYSYSLSHDVHGPQVVNDFVLRAHRGHCALFASAMAVMARSVGLPARYVTGFVASEKADGAFVVRGTDAHAWVEIYIDGSGWIAFDPTSNRIDPGDTRTRSLVRNGQPPNATAGGGSRGGGLYGRDPRSIDDRGTGSPQGGAAGDQVADAGPGGGGAGNSGGGNAAGGNDGGAPGIVNGGDLSGAGGDSGSPDQPGGTGPSGIASGSTNPAGGGTSGGGHGGTNGASGQTGDAGPKPSHVVPPGGRTDLPDTDRNEPVRPSAGIGKSADGPGLKKTPAKPSTSSQKPKSEPPTPDEMKSDWRLITAILVGIGIAGLLALAFWKHGVRPIAEKRQIRQALPPEPADDSDPRRLIVRIYHQMTDGLARLGFSRRPSTTPDEFASDVGQRRASLAAPVDALTELFHRARYWDQPVTDGDAEQARAAWKDITQSVTRVATGSDADES